MSKATPSSNSRLRPAIPVTCGLAALVGLLWLFPSFWYTASDTQSRRVWLSSRTQIDGWTFGEEVVAESAERLLVADELFSGAFTNQTDRTVIRAFTAKRFTSNSRDIGLFVHTPDRCWTQGGWKLQAVEPTFVEATVHGVPMVFERRVFVSGGHRELVYFGGLVGGQPLPYRLDHNYSVALKYQVERSGSGRDGRGAGQRAFDPLFWGRIWDSFVARRALLGPKQFVRISTTLRGGDLGQADAALLAFLPLWLQPVDFEQELAAWRESQS
ncbi:MAG: exosortase-associated EpsI family protein [Verrucomicrobiales bacterium]|nr:exosortase-associated EpsI family protein [Verrucomicrobiales bacterium]